MRRFSAALLAAVLLLTAAGCGRQTDTADDGRLQVVCTLFPYYDFVRQIGGDAVNAVLLVPAGRETHSFEPTPLDVITMSRADVFIWNGGESELWVEDVLDAALDFEKAGFTAEAVKLLEGARGMIPAQMDKVEDTLLRISQLADQHRFVKELDINPLMVSDKDGEPIAVDARIAIDVDAVKAL